ncbi:hypothetical protein NKDENANG_03949 [Candidatus Entotheonellaceae bacterium PAL068K]
MSEAYRTWLKMRSRIGRDLTILVSIATGLATIAGVLWNLYEFASAARERTKAARISQLTTYTNFGELLKHYREIEQKTDDFMRAHRNTHWDYEALLKQYETGASLYYSLEFKDFREIQQFYEELGTLVRFNALDFELVYQLITFPSDFYEKTKPLQDFLSAHWFELRSDLKKRRLREFGFNLSQLAENYERRRNHQPLQWADP